MSDATDLSDSRVVVPINQMGDFRKRMASLNTKAARFGVDPIKINGEPKVVLYRVEREWADDGESYVRVWKRMHQNAKIPCDAEIIRAYEIDLEYPIIKLGNWRVMAQLEPLGQGNLIFKVGGGVGDAAKLEEYRTCGIVCEHCNTQRQRKLSFVLKDDEAGAFKQVGSTCLEDFTGIDPGAALFLAKIYEFIRISDASDGFASGDYSGAATSLATQEYLARVAFLVEQFGFTSASKARDTPGCLATYEDATRLSRILKDESLEGAYGESYERLTGFASEIIQWYSQKVPADAFEENLKLLLTSEDILLERKHLAFAAAAVPMYQRHLAAAMRSKQTKPSRHVGAAGQKLSMSLTLERVLSFETPFGKQSRLIMSDTDGNSLTWKTSRPPDELLESAAQGKAFIGEFKIKCHGEYKDVPQTEVTHLKFKGWTEGDVNHAAVSGDELDEEDVAKAPRPRAV